MKKFKNESTIPVAQKKEHEITHAQRYTLLEPNNVIPSWEAGDAEMKEVSDTLTALRKKYDTVHRTVNARQKELDDLKKQLAKTTEEELVLMNSNGSMAEQA